MKYVRLFLLVLATSLFVAPVVSAQGGGGGGGGGQGRGGGRAMAALMANITLTADQQTKVDTISAKYRALRAPMSQDMDSTARAAAMAKNADLSQKQYDEIRAVLTADQQKVFDENRKNLPTGRRGGGPGKP